MLLRVLHVREGDRVGDRNCWHIEQAVDEHQREKGLECNGEGQADHGQPTDQVAGGQELFRREIPVGKQKRSLAVR